MYIWTKASKRHLIIPLEMEITKLFSRNKKVKPSGEQILGALRDFGLRCSYSGGGFRIYSRKKKVMEALEKVAIYMNAKQNYKGIVQYAPREKVVDYLNNLYWGLNFYTKE